MKFFKILFGIITACTFGVLVGFIILHIFFNCEIQSIYVICFFSVFILEVLFLPVTVINSNIYLKKDKVKNLTEQYNKTLEKVGKGELKNRIDMEENGKKIVKSIYSTEIIQEIFKSYANAMADL